MKKIFLSLAALIALTVAFAPQVQASPRSGHHATSHSHSHSSYHVTHGHSFSHGYYYSGRHHNHWTTSRWDSRYGCQCYYDSGCRSWYYWCQPRNCFYPVSYCPCQTYSFAPPVSAPATCCPTYVPPTTVTVQVQLPPIPAPCSTCCR